MELPPHVGLAPIIAMLIPGPAATRRHGVSGNPIIYTAIPERLNIVCRMEKQ
jgi:hypothetical protein